MMLGLERAKSFLKITDTTSDALISMLIPIAYQDIINETNNPFTENSSVVESKDFYFTAPDLITIAAGGFTAAKVLAGDLISVSGSRRNDGLYTVASISDSQIHLVDQTITSEAAGNEAVTVAVAIIPAPVDLVAARMIGYQLTNIASAGVQSMSLGNYSETRKTTAGGYPDELLNSLRPWKYMTTGRGTVHWHINENRTMAGVIGHYGD
jgi:hypothetical protein